MLCRLWAQGNGPPERVGSHVADFSRFFSEVRECIKDTSTTRSQNKHDTGWAIGGEGRPDRKTSRPCNPHLTRTGELALFAYSRRVSLRMLKEALAGVSSMRDRGCTTGWRRPFDVAENSKQGGA